MADNEKAPAEQAKRNTVTIKFGKGLVDEPFTSRAGKSLVQISIPNVNAQDKRPWETFVVPEAFVHDNKFGKGVWMKLPEDGVTKLTRNVRAGQDENGKTIWQKETRQVPNTELKAMLEAYKEKGRDSVLSDLADKKAEVSVKPRTAERAARHAEASR